MSNEAEITMIRTEPFFLLSNTYKIQIIIDAFQFFCGNRNNIQIYVTHLYMKKEPLTSISDHPE